MEYRETLGIKSKEMVLLKLSLQNLSIVKKK